MKRTTIFADEIFAECTTGNRTKRADESFGDDQDRIGRVRRTASDAEDPSIFLGNGSERPTGYCGASRGMLWAVVPTRCKT